MSQPAKYDIKLTAGDNFQVTLRLLEDGDPIDTQGYVFKAQARGGYLPEAPLLVDFAVTPVSGGAVLSLTPEQTREIGQASRVFWDFQSASPIVRTWLTGRVFVAQEVTA
jgi:hypothetical protein